MIEHRVTTKVMPVISIETHWNILRTDLKRLARCIWLSGVAVFVGHLASTM